MKKTILLSMLALIIAGCKADVGTAITTDDLTGAGQKEMISNVLVEVVSCTDYQDSRNESRSLIEAKSQIGRVLRNSEYVECYDKKMKSYASFDVPVAVGSGRDGLEFMDSDIYILNRDDIYLAVMLNPNLIERIEREEKASFMPRKIDLNMSISLSAKEKPIPKIAWQGVYLSDNENDAKKQPVMLEILDGEGVEKMIITLSDVANSTLMKGDTAVIGWYPEALMEALK